MKGMMADVMRGEKKGIPRDLWEKALAAVRARDLKRYYAILRDLRAQKKFGLASDINVTMRTTREWRNHEDEIASRSFQKQLPMLRQRCTPEQVAGIKYYSETGDILGAARKCDVHPLKFLAWLDSIDFSKYLPENE